MTDGAERVDGGVAPARSEARDALLVTELTARASGAVAVLAVEGPGAGAALRALGVAPPRPGQVRLARLVARGGEPSLGVEPAAAELLDEALAVALGADRFELHLHGSPAVVDRVRRELGAPTRRAATLEERAAERVADAPSEVGARILLDQSEGALRRALESLRHAPPDAARAGFAALAARGRAAAPHLVAPRVVLAGPSNAGKSTLFNALVGEARVLVDAAPGTTRDAVLERALLDGLVVELVDTAGERGLPAGAAGEAGRLAVVEAAGQSLARRLRAGADLVLWLRPADDPAGAAPPSGARVRVLDSCADRVPPADRARLERPIAALGDPAGARAAVAAVVAESLGPLAWAPGAAVPFEPEQLVAVERAAGEPALDRRQLLLAELLDGPPPPASAPLERTTPDAR